MAKPDKASAETAATEVTARPLSEFPDTSTFASDEIHAALDIPVKLTASLRKSLSSLLWRRPKIKNVYDHETDSKRRILLLRDDSVYEHPKVRELLEGGDCQKREYTIRLGYEDHEIEDILKKVLPGDMGEIPSSFETIGGLAHVNLREEQLLYKYWIGKVLLDKNRPRIRTVVNKVGTIDTVYRTFGMEVIAGYQEPDWSHVTLKEEGCTFSMDFTKVYWNSRLAGEHRRLVRLIQKDSRDRKIIVADLMAGIGPFAVPLTAQGGNVTLHANDLNPDSYQYLCDNVKRNKCSQIHCYNMCGRAMVRQLQEQKVVVDHFLMNLPASAPEFLDAFRGYHQNFATTSSDAENDATNTTTELKRKPRIHVHCFAPKEATGESSNTAEDYQSSVDRCAKALGCPLDRVASRLQVHVVRDVSPRKNMLCISFDLPPAVEQLPVREAATTSDNAEDEPKAKKPKTDGSST